MKNDFIKKYVMKGIKNEMVEDCFSSVKTDAKKTYKKMDIEKNVKKYWIDLEKFAYNLIKKYNSFQYSDFLNNMLDLYAIVKKTKKGGALKKNLDFKVNEIFKTQKHNEDLKDFESYVNLLLFENKFLYNGKIMLTKKRKLIFFKNLNHYIYKGRKSEVLQKNDLSLNDEENFINIEKQVFDYYNSLQKSCKKSCLDLYKIIEKSDLTKRQTEVFEIYQKTLSLKKTATILAISKQAVIQNLKLARKKIENSLIYC